MAEETWVTMNGTPVKLENGKPTGPVGEKIQAQERSLAIKRNEVEYALLALENGKPEATIPNLRNDLEQYGGTNDVTIIKGDHSKGLVHIAERHGAKVIPGVLEAMIDGKITRYSPGKKVVNIQKEGFEAVLSLDEAGRKKTWLLTGYDITPATDAKKALSDERGKVSARHAPTQTEPILSRFGLGADNAFMQKIMQMFPESKADHLTFDAKSVRTIDENGFLHVAVSHISKETVNPYRGNEIPGWQERGLDPQRIYFGYRKGEELEKAAQTFNGLPLLRDHHHESAEHPQKEFRIGTLGTSAEYRAPYLDNALIVTDASAIAEIESGERVELSCSYRYDPVFEPGVFEGRDYEFVMTNIRGNHCALVVEGRAGPDVAVADSAENINKRKVFMARSKDFFRKLAGLVLAKDAAPDAKVEEEEVDRAAEIIEKAQGIIDLHEETAEGIMDRPEGFDAETPDFQRGFAEGVKYGERKEKEEPKKLDSEHESEGMKKALDACGLDAENPDFQKAFAEGVKYGERKEKEAPKKLDSEHESEGMKKAMDTDKLVQSASDAAMNRFQSILDAQREVRPVVGEVAVNLASDSAETVYGAALDAMGVDKNAHPRSAWRSVFQVLARSRAEVAPHTASDAALAESPLKNIKVL